MPFATIAVRTSGREVRLYDRHVRAQKAHGLPGYHKSKMRPLPNSDQPNGARTSFMYDGKKCRINTYGDSFTQCHQVSDGETWQEYWAGHLGEPIRNFGMGGYGVYQA